MGNNTEGFFDNDYILDRPGIRAFLCISYTIVFILCFCGNLSVVIVLSLHWRMRSVTKFCMGNLAFANLCVAVFCIYQNLSTFLQVNWIFGGFLCKMYYFINSLSHTASVLILVVISVERFLSIVHPLKCRRLLTIQRLRLAIAGVWLLSGLISAPRLYYMTTLAIPYPPEQFSIDADAAAHNGSNGMEMVQLVICAPTPTVYNSSTAEIIYFVLLFLAPLLVMSILYAKIGSIIWQSSAMIRSNQSSREEDGPAIPLSVRMTRKVLQVPHTSLATQSSTSSSCSPRSSDSISSNHRGTKRSGVEKLSGYRPTAETVVSTSRSHLYDSESSSVSSPALQVISEAGDDENTNVSMCEVCERLHRQSCNNAAAALAVLRVKGERQSHAFRTRKSAVRMLIIIVVTFAACNFPYHLRRLFQYYVRSYDISSSFNQLLTPITFLLMYANCAVNPIFYAFLSKRFRSSFRDLLKFKVRRSYNDNHGGGSRGRRPFHHRQHRHQRARDADYYV